VQAAHYASVGAALIWTFRETMGAAFTAEEEAAWEVAYSLISGVMVEAAAEA
jgi:nitric oxide dioxygenase